MVFLFETQRNRWGIFGTCWGIFWFVGEMLGTILGFVWELLYLEEKVEGVSKKTETFCKTYSMFATAFMLYHVLNGAFKFLVVDVYAWVFNDWTLSPPRFPACWWVTAQRLYSGNETPGRFFWSRNSTLPKFPPPTLLNQPNLTHHVFSLKIIWAFRTYCKSLDSVAPPKICKFVFQKEKKQYSLKALKF